MEILAVPYHLDERLEGFTVGDWVDREVTAELPSAGPWQRMAVLYEQVAQAISAYAEPALVVSGDCTTSLGVLAGLQRSGRAPSIVWIDAHADFHTDATTISGYLGGMPLALAAGIGTLTLPTALGLLPVPESQIVLVDARDTDPGEHILLDRSAVRRTQVGSLDTGAVPDGEFYLHIDVDVCDPEEVPEFRYPAPGGSAVNDIIAAVRRLAATGRVAAVGIAATWRHGSHAASVHQELVRRLYQATIS